MLFLFETLICFISYYLTYYLHHTKKFGPIKASVYIALPIGIIFQILLYFDVQIEYFNQLTAIIMGATFMGMISNKHNQNYIDFLISSFIFCTLYKHTSTFFYGFGGLLGTIACISILCVFGIKRILSFFN